MTNKPEKNATGGDAAAARPGAVTPPRQRGLAPGAPPAGQEPSAGPGGAAFGAAGSSKFSRRSDWIVALVLLCATLIAYRGVWHAGFIWDDDGHLTRPDLRSFHGLWRMWFEPGATQQYYPFLHSAFWLEHRLWGDNPIGYHLANVLQHAAAAFLLYRVLRRLSLPGAFLAAAIFAVHPVCVESVAWVSEQKNTLSAVLYLAAAIAYLRFDRERRARWYVVGIGLFAVALASKTVTATLPAALLVAIWWKSGRILWRRDALPLLPWLCMGAVAGTVTAWMERTYIGTRNVDFKLSLVDRLLVAGRAVWFYLGKLFWPADLTFIYPHWRVDALAGWQYFFPAAALAVLGALYALRSRWRGPLASALLFAGTLSPALGFINVYPFVYSYVADHFQYLASAMAFSATAAALALGVSRLPRGGRMAARAAAVCAVIALAGLTSRQCSMYADSGTLWRTTVGRNPKSWMAHDNLGAVLLKEGKVDDAIAQYREAIQAEPTDVIGGNLLGVALLQEQRTGEAVAQLEGALEIRPDYFETHNNLGVAFLQMGKMDEAIAEFGRALEIDPRSTPTRINIGNALLLRGRPADAIVHFEKALEVDPDSAEAHDCLANALRQDGRTDEAIAHYKRSLEIEPNGIEANNDLGVALLEKKRVDEAVARFRRALEIDPGSAKAHVNLGNVLLGEGRVLEAIPHYQRALATEPNDAKARNNLGYGFLHEGRLDEAVAQFQKALEINPGYSEAKRNLGIALSQREQQDRIRAR